VSSRAFFDTGTGVCTPVAEDVGSIGDGLAVPIGIYNS
jgi:hypothetical protein